MVLGDIQRTRRLAGNPLTSNVSDADITQGLTYGTSEAITLTGKADWETDILNPLYPTIVMAVEYFASGMVRDRFNDQIDISTEHFNRAMALCQQVTIALASAPAASGGSGTGAAVVVAPYRTYPLNPSNPPYRSLKSPGQILPGIEIYVNFPQ